MLYSKTIPYILEATYCNGQLMAPRRDVLAHYVPIVDDNGYVIYFLRKDWLDAPFHIQIQFWDPFRYIIKDVPADVFDAEAKRAKAVKKRSSNISRNHQPIGMDEDDLEVAPSISIWSTLGMVVGIIGLILLGFLYPVRAFVADRTPIEIPFYCTFATNDPAADAVRILGTEIPGVEDTIRIGSCVVGFKVKNATFESVQKPQGILVPVGAISDSEASCFEVKDQPNQTMCTNVTNYTGDADLLLDYAFYLSVASPPSFAPK